MEKTALRNTQMIIIPKTEDSLDLKREVMS